MSHRKQFRNLAASLPVALSSCLVISMTTPSTAAQPLPLPAAVADQYQAEMDPLVSDDFNAIDPDKWVVRAKKGDPDAASGKITASHNQIQREGDNAFLSLVSSLSGEAGLSALHPHRYGFTVCRWRLRGIEVGKKYAAHPAIWGFSYNMGSEPRNAPNPNGKTIEIDWMEYIKWQAVPGYHARVIPADEGISDTSRSVYMFQDSTDFSGWKTHGFEYTPDYVQMWQHVSGDWKKLGVPVRFGDTTSDEDKTIDRDYRSAQYFILSNIWFHKPEYELTPVQLDIDYLHHYKMD